MLPKLPREWSAVAVLLMSLAAGTTALKCWQCGQYSDGVGSITPCNNQSAAKLNNCAKEAKYCIKYVSELTVVRDCVPTCTEKEWWGARTFCCDTDECNGAVEVKSTAVTAVFAVILTLTALLR